MDRIAPFRRHTLAFTLLLFGSTAPLARAQQPAQQPAQPAQQPAQPGAQPLQAHPVQRALQPVQVENAQATPSIPDVVTQQGRRIVALREALDLAARQGPDVAQARANAAVAQVSVERAWTAWKPDLVANGQFDHTNTPAELDFRQFAGALSSFTNLTFTGGPVPPPVTIVGANSTYGTLQLSQPLFSPQGLLLIGPANRAAEAASLGADESREQVLLSVARAYLGVKGLYGLLEAARDAENVALRREHDARARISAGTAVEVDLLRAQNDTAIARVNIANIQGQILSLLPLLEALTGAPIAPDAAVAVDPDLGKPGDPAEQPWERAFAVRSAVQQVSAAAGAARFDTFAWLPSVQGIAKGNYNSNAGFTGKNTSYDLIIAASIPLYDRGQRYAAKHENEARLSGAQAALASTRARARANWLGAQANLTAAQAVLAQSEVQVQFASRAQAQIDASARAGVATSLDLSDADNRLFQARSSVSQARTALDVRRAEIAVAEGRLFQSVGR
jgi:outer membrane protein